MKQFQKFRIPGSLAALIFSGALLGSGIAVAQENGDNAGAEVLTRGPVHEAFAGTVSFDPQVGIIVDQAPPDLIEEVPPSQRLEGDNVAWIPGYWAWDEDQAGYLWISGIWRNLPPGRQWVPGYWATTEGRYQWTSGYWEDRETTEVAYLPAPPRSVESGPSVAAASIDQTYIPGNWVYRDDRYAWGPGYWVDAREDWCWTPAYYRWTPLGYVYVDGYWDYPVARRGVVFAPVRFQRAYISRPDFYYTPSTVISISVFSDHLFLRPDYGHYYFGDYYEPRYRSLGIYASFSFNSSHRGYDPIYAYDRWEHRHDRDWERGRRDHYEYRRNHRESRPPRTWAALSARSQADRERGDFGVAERLDRVASNRGKGRQRFQSVGKQERERFVSQRQEIRKFASEREQSEARGDRRAATGGKNRADVSKVKINRSPVAAKRSDRSDKDGGPPARLQPRASERDQRTDKAAPAGNGRKSAGREDPAELKGKNDGGVKREDQPRKNDKVERTVERRVKPGQRRESSPTTERQVKPDEKRKATPGPERKASPGERREAAPVAEPTATATPKRQATSSPERRVSPGQRREAAPSAEGKASPKPKRPVTPSPERKATPAPRGVAIPDIVRKPEPDKKREPAAVSARKPDPDPARHQAAPQRTEQKSANRAQPQQANRRVVPAEPKQQKAARLQPQPTPQRAKTNQQRAQRAEPKRPQQAAQPQRAVPRQQAGKAKPKSTTAVTEEEEENRKKKQNR